MSQSWSPDEYGRDARFVSDLATPVVELLSPRAGERILDLGCGDGVLSHQLSKMGCVVVGVDSSPEMIEAALQRGVNARVMDGEDLAFHQEFDAVFSNAVLHWMTRPDQVIAGVRRALKPGGRFVGEFGGYGNIATVIRALHRAMDDRGLAADHTNPWYFPTVEEYRTRLETQSMDVHACALIPRPTRLSTDIVGWLKVFARGFMDGISETEHETFLRDVSGYCEGELRTEDGQWILDYVRLRFAAIKR